MLTHVIDRGLTDKGRKGCFFANRKQELCRVETISYAKMTIESYHENESYHAYRVL